MCSLLIVKILLAGIDTYIYQIIVHSWKQKLELEL